MRWVALIFHLNTKQETQTGAQSYALKRIDPQDHKAVCMFCRWMFIGGEVEYLAPRPGSEPDMRSMNVVITS